MNSVFTRKSAWSTLLLLPGLLTPSLPVLAQNARSCSGLFTLSTSENSADSVLMAIDELVTMQTMILKMPEGADRSLAVADFQRKVRELARTVGPEFKRLFEERAGGGRARTEIAALKQAEQEKEAERERNLTRARDADIVLRFTRVRRHEAILAPGPFLSDTRMIAVTPEGLRVHDFATNGFVPHPAIDAIRFTASRSGGKPELALSPDGNTLAFGIAGQKLELLDLRSGKRTRTKLVLPELMRSSAFLFSRSGRELFFTGRDGKAVVYSLSEKKKILDQGSSIVGFGKKQIIQSPDGRWVFFILPNGSQVLFDLVEREVRKLPDALMSSMFSIENAVFSADSGTLTLADFKERLADYRLADGTHAWSRFSTRSNEIQETPDGKYLMAGHRSAEPPEDHVPVELFELDTGKRIELAPNDLKYSWITDATVSRSGGYVIYVERKETKGGQLLPSIYMLDIKTRVTTRYALGNPPPDFDWLGTTPDGKSILGQTEDGDFYEIH